MRLRLSLRNQLLLFVLFLIIGLLLQLAVTNIAQDNIADIQEQKEIYLNRDEEVANSLNQLVVDTNDLINFRLEEYLSALLQNDTAPDYNLFSAYEQQFSRTLRLLLDRNEIGYNVNDTGVLPLPIVYESEEFHIGHINHIVVDNETSAYRQISFIQTQVDAIITGVERGTDNLRGDYLNVSSLLTTEINQIQNSISIIRADLGQMIEDISQNTNATYRQDTTAFLVDLSNDISAIEDTILLAYTGLNSEDVLSETFADIPSELTTAIDTLINDISTTIQSLNEYGLQASDQNSLDSIVVEYDTNVEERLDELTAYFGDLVDVKIDIGDYKSSRFIDAFETTKDGVLAAKAVFDEENHQFIHHYDLYVDQLTRSSQILTLWITAGLGTLILIMAIPMVFRIRSSTNWLNKSIKRLSEGDLTISTERSTRSDEFGEIEKEFINLTNSLKDIVGVIQESSSRLAGISEELAAGAEEASASINDVSQTASAIASSANQQNALINRVKQTTRDLNRQIREITYRINETSNYITTIASRTNILGLNATISAAKSGEAGRGFSIVANEIRELARSTKISGDEITELVSQIAVDLNNLNEEIDSEIDIISGIAMETATRGNESNEATNEQVIMISEISNSSNDLAQLASSLNEIISQFKL